MRLGVAAITVMAIGVVALSTADVVAQNGGLRAGMAAVKITPSVARTVYIAGYNNNRIAESVHDDLWARALVLDDGRTRMALVGCDLIGLSNSRVRKIRQRVKGVPAENVLIACTHVHSGPDTLGLWGKSTLSSGIDPEYMAQLEGKIAEAVDTAAAKLTPARLSAAKVEVPDGLVHNSREPLQDKELTAVRFTSDGGSPIGTLVHYGGHPEVNKSKALTSDFVHYVREAVEQRFGGVALFANGALGGMVTPQVEMHTLEEMERVGTGVGAAAVRALDTARPVEVKSLALSRREVEIPLENEGFKLLLAGKVLDGESPDGKIHTEVWRMALGPITLVSIPGEILPRPALALKSKMPGRFPMVVALGNDELGYILDPDDFERPLYKYEKSMSVGKEAWPRLHAAALELLR
jgi:hypothetical protein